MFGDPLTRQSDLVARAPFIPSIVRRSVLLLRVLQDLQRIFITHGITKAPQVFPCLVRLVHRISENLELRLGSLVDRDLTGLGCLDLPTNFVLRCRKREVTL